MNFRTDLALERREALDEECPQGISCNTYTRGDAKITEIEVLSDEAAARLGKPRGRYVTVELPSFSHCSQLSDERADALADALSSLLPANGEILVAGLGNDEITPDALGPKFARLILATRHLSEELTRSAGLPELRPVSVVTPGVLGKTGVETGEIISGVVGSVKPAAVVTVDALAARRLSRLGCTVQFADTGITPGSGVGNSRREVNEATLGVPVIAIGVPTVVDAATLVSDLGGSPTDGEAAQMMVTPREIDLMIDRAASLLALAVNSALQKELSHEDILMLVG